MWRMHDDTGKKKLEHKKGCKMMLPSHEYGLVLNPKNNIVTQIYFPATFQTRNYTNEN
jgi:hypothetical protein